jgi:hypothetical protein
VNERPPAINDILLSAIDTLRDVVLPNLNDSWAQTCTRQLIGLMTFGLHAGSVPGPVEQAAALSPVVAELEAEFPELAAFAPHAAPAGSSAVFMTFQRVSDLLAYGVSKNTAAAAAIRERLRPVALECHQQDLEATARMIPGPDRAVAR